MEEGTEGGIHAIRLLWEHYYQEEDWVFIFIDAQNSFNEENQTAMIWDVQYEWPSGMQFIFNYYRHWATLGVQNLEGLCHFLHIREVVTQGEPLDMIEYGIGVLPIIQELQDTQPRITQPWYADDTGAGGSFGNIFAHFKYIQAGGPLRDTSQNRPRVSWS